jgi:tetratricopeptide (TPR) repeat protein
LTVYGRFLSATKKIDEAMTVWSDLAERSPMAIEPKLQIARLLQARRDPEAEMVLRSILGIDPQHREALRHLAQFLSRRAGTVDQGLAVWERLADLDPKTVTPILERARVMERAHRSADAETEYRRAIARNPRDISALAEFARFFRLRGEYENAIRIYEAQLQIEPERVEALLGLGQCHDRLDRLEEARACYERALVREPNNVTALGYRARLQRISGQIDAAIEDFRKICITDPSNPAGWHELIYLLATAERQAEALAAVDEAIVALGDTSKTWIALAQSCAAAQLDTLAVRYFQQAIAAEPENANYRGLFGMY